jgi:dipeptidyl aminopeptidase
VYEEEVFSSSSSLWFSPTSTHIAFLRLNETLVPSFEYPLYDPSTNGVDPYPQEIMMRYPKPGFPNPTVDVFVFSLEHYFDATSTAHRNVDECLKRIEWKGLMDRTDQVVFDVLWVKNGDGLLIKESDRSAGKGNVVLVYVPTGGLWHEGRKARTLQGQVVRELSGEGGWIEQVRLLCLSISTNGDGAKQDRQTPHERCCRAESVHQVFQEGLPGHHPQRGGLEPLGVLQRPVVA